MGLELAAALEGLLYFSFALWYVVLCMDQNLGVHSLITTSPIQQTLILVQRDFSFGRERNPH